MHADEFENRLRQLHRHTSELRSLVEQIQTHTPVEAAATDPSGSVHVQVDPDGVPRVIRVEPGWRHRTGPEGLAASVLAAYQAAAGRAVRALTRMPLPPPPPAAPAAPVPPPPPVHGHPRDPMALTEEILKALHTVRTRAATPAPTYVGHAGRGRLSIALSPSGLHGCSIEPAWAAQQSTATVNAALRDALRTARARLSADASSRRAEADLLDTLAGEALATLAQVTSPVQAPEGFNG